MKKGLYILVILLIGIGCYSQNAFAFLPVTQGSSINATVVLNVAANPNAQPINKLQWGALDTAYFASSANNSTAANLGASNAGSYNVTWKEKALYGSGTISPIITVKNLVQGDLVVRVDLVSTGGGSSNMTVVPYWLRSGSVIDPSGFGYNDTIIELCSNNQTPAFPGGAVNGVPSTVSASNLQTLALARGLAANTTTTLFNFTTPSFPLDGEVIISAFLVDNVAATNPQVIAVDTETIYFAPPSWPRIISATTNEAG